MMSTNPSLGVGGMVLITKDQIQQRVKELAQQINFDYRNKELVVIGVLKGAYAFLADLVKELKSDISIDFVQIQSYEGTESSGNIELKKEITINIHRKHVLIVEDILDTGMTLSNLLVYLSVLDPLSVKIAVLLDKPARRQVAIKADYVGFKIQNKFVYGYGLDYKEKFRNLQEIRVLE